MEDLRYLQQRDTFLDYAYLALKEHFSSREDFVNYFNSIKTDQMKDTFLKTTSFYLFLVKQGDWIVRIPGSKEVIDYLTNSYKYITIFSLIESISKEKYMDFYSFLKRKKSRVEFPITKNKLDEYYSNYNNDFGSIRKCISFFKALPLERQNALTSGLEIQGRDSTIEEFARCLYDMRSKFAHEVKFVLHMSGEMSIGYYNNKIIVCTLSINDIMRLFEEGLLIHFQSSKNSKNAH